MTKTSDAQLGFMGFPSVGKSVLLCILARVYSEVAAHELTTLTTAPRVIRYKGAKIQLLDLPGCQEWEGRGSQDVAVAGLLNLILIVLGVLKPLGHKIIENYLKGFSILEQQTP